MPLNYLPYLLLIISATVGVACLIYSLIDSRDIFLGIETSIRRVIINSILAGIAGGALFFTISILGWFYEQSEPLSFNNLAPVCTISLILGLVLFLGSILRFFTIGKYRDWLFKKINRK